MHIVIVGGGTAGWMAALTAVKRHTVHKITVIESTKIGVIGVGESTTGLLTDLLTNHLWDFDCDHDEFIAETGATLKYAIKHKGWTNNIDDYYLGPIDGSNSTHSVPDPLFAYGLGKLKDKDIANVSRMGYLITHGMSNFDKTTNSFLEHKHAMHVDAHLVGKYFKKKCLKSPNATHIDSEVINVNLKENGFIKSVDLINGETIEGDFFIDCSGFSRVLMSKVPTSKWVSYQDNLPVNTGLPFQLTYLEDEMPEPYTTAWAQSAGWMWQIPLMDRKGCGYVFDDRFTTPEQAQDEVEMRLGRKIDPIKVIKFNAGRQESAWVKNCVTIGLSSAFVEPLEATSIHSTLVQIKNLFFEYIKPTLEETINEGSMKIYNKRTRQMFDDFRDFIVMHYMGGRTDSEFWKYINTGATQTEFVSELLEMAKSRLPSTNDFPKYWGSAGWPLWSYVMAGIGRINKKDILKELDMEIPGHGHLGILTAQTYYDLQDQWAQEIKQYHTYDDFIRHFRNIRARNGL